MVRIPDAVNVASLDTHALIVTVPYDGAADVASSLPRRAAADVLRQIADQLDAQPCPTAAATGMPCPVHDAPGASSRGLHNAGRQAAEGFARGIARAQRRAADDFRTAHAERKRLADVLAAYGAALADNVRAAARGELGDADHVTTVEEAVAHLETYGADLRDPQHWTPPLVGMLDRFRRALADDDKHPADGEQQRPHPFGLDPDHLEQLRQQFAPALERFGRKLRAAFEEAAANAQQAAEEDPATPAEGDQYIKRADPDEGRVVTVERVWTADDGHTSVAYKWQDPRASYAGSACPLDVFHRTYRPATEPADQ